MNQFVASISGLRNETKMKMKLMKTLRSWIEKKKETEANKIKKKQRIQQTTTATL